VIVGDVVGRRSPGDLTMCDLTGTGVQDTAIATLAVARAKAAQAGTRFET
jgi:ornithine cyclodeaminase